MMVIASGNREYQAKIMQLASEHLRLIIRTEGSTIFIQAQTLLDTMYNLVVAASDYQVRNNICVAYRK